MKLRVGLVCCVLGLLAGNAAAEEKEVGFISPRDRVIISKYLEIDHLASCPPQLPKGKHGCLNDKAVKKSYKMGKKLPKEIVPLPLPMTLASRVRRLPHGYHYSVLDGDVILISDEKNKVIDAVTLEAALGM